MFQPIERMRVRLRWDVFNVTNSVRFDVGSIGRRLDQPTTFGYYTQTLTNPRVMQVALRVEFLTRPGFFPLATIEPMQGKPNVVALLNEALKEELTAISQYFLHAEMCENWHYSRLGDYIKKQSIDEMKHAEALIERILFLDKLPI